MGEHRRETEVGNAGRQLAARPWHKKLKAQPNRPGKCMAGEAAVIWGLHLFPEAGRKE